MRNTQTYTMPAPLAGMLARLPAYPGAWLFARALNLALAPQLPEDVKAALSGRSMRLRVSDARLAFDFTWQRGGFVPMRAGETPDLTIGACVHDLVRLARREEDPDTLFFSRRLALEGDTELGLLFKNTLDALDTSAFDPATLFGWRRARA
jgi:O2-independent ubiquinone biosynthesis accessory factor UbiT